MLQKTLRHSRLFLLLYSMFMLVAGFMLVQCSRPDLHLFLNRFHTPFFDWFFRHITFLGNGIFLGIVALFFLFFSLRSSVYLIVSYLGSGLITQVFKRLLFEDWVRPSAYFADPSVLHLVNGVQLLSGHSFPSGHATSAFAMFFCLAAIGKKTYVQLTCLFLACIVAYSRVYLSQHFLEDIVAGSFIGTATAFGFYLAIYRNEKPWHRWTLLKAFSHG